MNQEQQICEALFYALTRIKQVASTVYPSTFISKAMLDAGIKTAMYLCFLDKDDDNINESEPLPLMWSPIFVDIKLVYNETYQLTGSISCNGNTARFTTLPWEPESVEEIVSNIEFSKNLRN